MLISETSIVGASWPVEGNRVQFELALLNLAINARDAMPDGGALTISAENHTADEAKHVKIAVADNGHGMSAEIAAKAFDPFFSTKPTGQGTGLGLAQVYSFAQQSNGHAFIESTPGQGATVILMLPAV